MQKEDYKFTGQPTPQTALKHVDLCKNSAAAVLSMLSNSTSTAENLLHLQYLRMMEPEGPVNRRSVEDLSNELLPRP
jgi:hypothetical protein